MPSSHAPIMQTSPGAVHVFASPVQMPLWHASLIVQ
jgi:hypothetical protein